MTNQDQNFGSHESAKTAKQIAFGVFATVATTLFAWELTTLASVGFGGIRVQTAGTRIAALALSVVVFACTSVAVVCFYRLGKTRRVLGNVIGLPLVFWNLLICWRLAAPVVATVIFGT